VYQAVGYLYYEHTLVGPGVFDAEILGTGLCLVSGARSTVYAARRERRHEALAIQCVGGLIYDGRAVLLGCRHLASFDERQWQVSTKPRTS
jgi:hypothetical protein